MIHTLLLLLTLSAPPEPGLCTPAQVVRVIDGDTAVVVIRFEVHVRLLECWAPEISAAKDAAEKARGQASKAFVEKLLAEQGRDVLLAMPLSADGDLTRMLTLGRVLGRLYLKDGRDLSAAIRDRGFATKVKGGL